MAVKKRRRRRTAEEAWEEILEAAERLLAAEGPAGIRLQELMQLLTRKGYLIEEQGMTYLADTDRDTALAPLQAAACTYHIALGPRAGQKVLSLQTVPSPEAQPPPQHCVNEQGSSLHAEV